MDKKASFLNETMEEIFSLVPSEEVVSVSREVVQNYLGSDRSAVSSIRWVEFNLDGSFVRGGISDVALMSTQLVTNWNADPIIEEIVELAGDFGIKPGELIEAQSCEGYFWCVPYRPRDIIATPVDRTRAVLLTEGLFDQIVELFNSDAGLTKSEKRIAYQIVIGKNPTLAAEADGVSVETKRTQLKAAAGKLECHGQSELVRLLVSQLIHLLYLCEAETSHIQLTEQFGNQFFGSLGRLSVQRLPNGRVMRFWEFGPANGRPILAMHGYMFPFLVLEAETELQKHNLRLVLPVRGGFLDDQTSGALQIDRLVDQNVEDFSQFAECIWNEPVPVLGHNMGGFYAMLLAKRRPDLFDTAVIASIILMRNKEVRSTFAAKFMTGFRKLANDLGILEIAAKQYQRTVYSSSRATKVLLRRFFKDSPIDLDLINGRIGSGPAFEWFRQIALHSVAGISSDLRMMSEPCESFLTEVPSQVTFIHGMEDPFTSAAELSELAKVNPKATLRVLDVGGHYVSASHPSIFWEEISNCIAK